MKHLNRGFLCEGNGALTKKSANLSVLTDVQHTHIQRRSHQVCQSNWLTSTLPIDNSERQKLH